MKFDIYNRFIIEIIRKDGRWLAFRLGEGSKIPEANLIVPQDLGESELITFLDDIFHECALPGKLIKKLD